MLIVAPVFPAPVPLAVRVYGCEAVAWTRGRTGLFRLGACTVGSAWGAVLWLCWRGSHVADQLDAAAARPVRAWLADREETERACAALEAGRGYAHVVADGPVRYVLSAVPRPAAGPDSGRSGTPRAAPQGPSPERG
ncbi:hypothetical protein PJ985_04015 [Streptomyces sp. ACA25]|uniref:hypothetical protein n=1 Tax=Streptomyces sp. ACA25 TaxID=3022596 RepID=UPI0023079908|nr:hypothetical protein [Streptomyces sp. ACA25]MDB1086731.1 hypothetical protein [Streptomyces sp. ACA25]